MQFPILLIKILQSTIALLKYMLMSFNIGFLPILIVLLKRLLLWNKSEKDLAKSDKVFYIESKSKNSCFDYFFIL